MTAADSAELVGALGAPDPFVAASAVLARPTLAALEKPEVKGRATLFVQSSPGAAQEFRGQRDAIHPLLSPQPGWVHVPLDGSARIRIDLTDEDLQYDDPIGAFEISGEALHTAATLGRIYQFKVADQTANTVLFAGVSVMPE